MVDFRKDVLYTSSNEWVKKLDDIVRIGIDDYSQSSLGDIVHIEISKTGTHVTMGKSFGSIEATKSVCDINAPVSGVIVSVNEAVIKTPSLINLSPFDEGWIAEIQPENISELLNLMNSEEYKNFIAK